MVKKTMAVDVLRSLGVTDKPAGSAVESKLNDATAVKAEGVKALPGADSATKGATEPASKVKAEQGGDDKAERDIRRVSVHLNPEQHRQLRILSINTDTPIWKLCVDALVKAGMVSP